MVIHVKLLSNRSIDVLSLVKVLHANFCFHSSWTISLGSRVAGANISRGSNIKLIKLRVSLFEVGKVLFTALI